MFHIFVRIVYFWNPPGGEQVCAVWWIGCGCRSVPRAALINMIEQYKRYGRSDLAFMRTGSRIAI
ncbi:MAG: hypothetical protein ABF904_04305 [Ethanoligenens sp.]